MKKTTILILILMLVFTGMTLADKSNDQNKEKNRQKTRFNGFIIKTYTLKYISPEEVKSNLNRYYRDSSYAPGGNLITVNIASNQVKTFEKFLEKIDVEKKKILIRIFSIIASHHGNNGVDAIDNRELKGVLKELQKVLSFKSFSMDGVSAVTVTDRQYRSRLALASKYPLKLTIEKINIRTDKKGKRSIAFDLALIQKNTAPTKEGNWVYDSLIETETSVSEKGFLVAGVSKIGQNGDSLVLVINAEIK